MVHDPAKYGLPPRVFLYTVDQLAVILDIPVDRLHREYLYHDGRDIGIRQPSDIVARNIAPPDKPAEWRVAEQELIRWMRSKGYKYYNRGTITK